MPKKFLTKLKNICSCQSNSQVNDLNTETSKISDKDTTETSKSNSSPHDKTGMDYFFKIKAR